MRASLRLAFLLPPLVLGVTASGRPADGLALTPPMGWNSWNRFGCNVSEKLDPGGRGRPGGHRHEGRGVPVRRDRRLLAGETRRQGPHRARSRALPLGDEGPRRLRAREGAEVRPLFRCGHRHLPETTGEQGPRRDRCPHLRRMGRRLPQVRLVQRRRPGHPRFLRPDEPRAARERPSDRLQHLRVGQHEAVALGPGHRPPVAHDGGHPGLLGLRQKLGRDGGRAHHRPPGRPPPVRRPGALERPRHAGGRQRGAERGRVACPLQLLGPLRRAAHGRQRPPEDVEGDARRSSPTARSSRSTRMPSACRAARSATTGPRRSG